MKDVKNLPSITPVRLPTIVPVRTPRRVVLLTSTALPALAFNTSCAYLQTRSISSRPSFSMTRSACQQVDSTKIA